MALGSTQTLREMSTRDVTWEVKVTSTYDLQIYHIHKPTV